MKLAEFTVYRSEGEKHFGEVKLRLTACLRRNVRLTTFINACLLKIRVVCLLYPPVNFRLDSRRRDESFSLSEGRMRLT